MKKLILKSGLYFVLILLVLEIIVRAFHLTKDYPVRYVDEHNVEKWVPNQEGYSVTGNRRMNFSEYHINNSGFNSYREYNPTKDKVEIALVGDSFIEGFHQNYYNSIGKKIENKLKNVEVYEFGYAGYDLADQLHLVYQYKSKFDLIDHVILYLKFENDLTRGEYGVLEERMRFQSPIYKNLIKIKLLVYLKNIGAFTAVRQFAERLLLRKPNTNSSKIVEVSEVTKRKNQKFIDNFKNLVAIYGYDKSKYVLLLDQSKTPEVFLDYLNENNFHFIDFGKSINNSKLPTTLIYSQYWNNYGRTLIAKTIADYISQVLNKRVNF